MRTRLRGNSAIRCPPMCPSEAAEVRCPVLLIDGEKSPDMFRRTAAALQAWLPDARRETVRGASHGMNLAHPARVQSLRRRIHSGSERVARMNAMARITCSAMHDAACRVALRRFTRAASTRRRVSVDLMPCDARPYRAHVPPLRRRGRDSTDARRSRASRCEFRGRLSTLSPGL